MTRPASAWGLSPLAVDGWRDDARCNGKPQYVTAATADRAATWSAKKFCHGCPVMAACLSWALANDERHNVWGGLSEAERARVKAGAQPGPCAREECGITIVPTARIRYCYACSERSNNRARRKSWRPPGDPVPPKERHDQVVELRDDGCTALEIAKTIGATEHATKSYLRRHYTPAA